MTFDLCVYVLVHIDMFSQVLGLLKRTGRKQVYQQGQGVINPALCVFGLVGNIFSVLRRARRR